jgi:hypothetical protein
MYCMSVHLLELTVPKQALLVCTVQAWSLCPECDLPRIASLFVTVLRIRLIYITSKIGAWFDSPWIGVSWFYTQFSRNFSRFVRSIC